MTTDTTVIYHNPRCSKSRETLQILEDNHLQPDIIEYLDDPPTATGAQTNYRHARNFGP